MKEKRQEEREVGGRGGLDASKGPPNVAFYVACVELSFRIWYLPYSSY